MMVWLSLTALTFTNMPNMAAAKDKIKAYDDDGKNPNCDWRRLPGGEALRPKYVCDAHEKYTVCIRLNTTSTGVVELQRRPGDVHATANKEYNRKNAALSKVQKQQFVEGKRFGATPGAVMRAAQQDGIDAGKVMTPEAPGSSQVHGVEVEGATAASAHALCSSGDRVDS